MAFPTSPSNNDVHKEGNRSFVYDSTLGTWDQVRETDRFSVESGGGAWGRSGTGVSFPAGHVLQILHSYSDSQLSTQVTASSEGWYTPSQFIIAITPKAGNKVLCQYHVHLGNTGQSDAQPVTAMFRDSTKIGIGAADGAKIRVSTGKVGPLASESAGNFTTHSSIWLDDPNADGSTSFDYKVGIAARGTGSSGTVYTNRTGTDANSNEWQRTSSSIVVMEIAQ